MTKTAANPRILDACRQCTEAVTLVLTRLKDDEMDVVIWHNGRSMACVIDNNAVYASLADSIAAVVHDSHNS